MNEEYFVSYETAKKLKKAGFNEICWWYYMIENAPEGQAWTTVNGIFIDYRDVLEKDTIIPCPNLEEVQKWLREVKGIEVYVVPRFASTYEVVGTRLGKTIRQNSYVFASWEIKNPHSTYEAALSAGIDAALDFITNKSE